MSYTSIRNFGFIFTSLILGTLVAGRFPSSNGSDESTSSVVMPGQFVQEPTERTSRRPNFSNEEFLRSKKQSNNRSNFLMMRTFQEAIGNSWKSAVQILVDGEQVALGAVVGADGWIVTKASELPSGKRIICRLHDDQELEGEVVRIAYTHDIALVRVQADYLPAVTWETSIPNQGSWLATVDLRTIPRSVGVMSAGVQTIRQQKPVLGVNLDSSPEGALVMNVLPSTGAFEAGIKVDDRIIEANGAKVFTLETFQNAIAGSKGGEFVHLKVLRRNKEFDVEARLMDLTRELLDETELEVNGRVSARATGFESVFMHDTVLEPNQCGGPLVNLDGRVVGINIARAGRVTTYAVPTEVVRPIVEGLIEQAQLVSRSQETHSTLRPIR